MKLNPTELSELDKAHLTRKTHEKFQNVGVSCSLEDVRGILDYDPLSFRALMDEKGGFGWCTAQAVLKKVKPVLRQTTRDVIRKDHSYVLEGPIDYIDSENKTIYYAYAPSGAVQFAKVNLDLDQFNTEVGMRERIGEHENIIPFLKTFAVDLQRDGPKRMANVMIMPFHPRSVKDFQVVAGGKLPNAALAVIARDCYSALVHIHSKGLCYGDLKPKNIMLSGHEPKAILIDFESVVEFGDTLTRCTRRYSLDAYDRDASEETDWTCLGATLAHLAGIDEMHFYSTKNVKTQVHSSDIEESIKTVIIACLNDQKSNAVGEAISKLTDFTDKCEQ